MCDVAAVLIPAVTSCNTLTSKGACVATRDALRPARVDSTPQATTRQLLKL